MSSHDHLAQDDCERLVGEPATDILGVKISALNLANAVATIERWIAQESRQYVCICTVHTLMECQQDAGFREVVNGAGLKTPDGMPLVWLSRWAGNRAVERVYGPDLMLALCERSATTGHRHFFYGGAPGVVELLVDRLQERFSGLQVAGTYTPPMLAVGQLEDPTIIQKINDSGADIVWVGLGAPKQDWWIAKHRPHLQAPVLIAVGAAFDFHSGTVRQAPTWIQNAGFEWLFRLTQDPRRLWKRYMVYNSLFIVHVVRQKLAGVLSNH